MEVLLLAIVIQCVGGTVALLGAKSARFATTLGAGAAVLGCALGMAPAIRVLGSGIPELMNLNWDATHGAFRVEIDSLSAFFLLPVFGLSALAAIYGGSYLISYRDRKNLGTSWFFFNVFVAGMVLVLMARTALLFLVAWEVMSLAAYCLVTFEHEKAEVRRAGWVYLIATHVGVIVLFVVFLLLGRHARGLEFRDFQTVIPISPGLAGLIFVLSLIGFGTKAGLVPFHVWLPEAHPAAPSHVSALMSGVMIKMGLYGILRVLSFLGPPAPWWGVTLAALGLTTALVGISLAMSQRDIKRVLAYSSIENMGLIALSLGVGVWGLARGLPAVALLGMTGALLHIWNHALMKGLMFFAAGSVLHGAGTKDMEKLGGLMKRMPWTGSAMMIGAVAIAALPPMNGFASKWLMYLSLMKCGIPYENHGSLLALLVVGLLALVGGLAALAFIRLTGIVLLGSPRSEKAEHAHESSPWMVGPILLLVALCMASAVAPHLVTNSLVFVLAQFHGPGAGQALRDLEVSDAPLATVGIMNAWTWIVAGSATALLIAWTMKQVRRNTWGCGYVKPTVRMQYTGCSFVEMISEHLLPRTLRARTQRHSPLGLFPASGDFVSACPDPVSDTMYEPYFRRWADRFARLRVLQQGKVNVYLVYILIIVIVLLGWESMRTLWRNTS